MGSTVKKIALLSGGGDCPGLNAVIRTITKTAISKYGYEVIGFVYGYRGLYHNNYVELTEESVEDIYKEGGTILYSSNKDNLFDYLVDDGHGGKVKKDVSDVAVENLKKEFKGYQINILFSALRTKNVREMLERLQQVPNVHIYLTTFEHPKAIELSEVSDLASERVSIVSLWQFGLADILEKMTNEDVLVVTGSLYFISEVRHLLIQLGGDHEV